MPHRVLVVDDMAIVRRMLVRYFERQPDWQVVGSVGNGQLALDATQRHNPDLITLDIEMPVLDGIGTLEELSRRKAPSSVVLLSSQNNSDSPRTIRALELGAFDFVQKPDGSEGDRTLELFEKRLGYVLSAWALRRGNRPPLTPPPPPTRFPATASLEGRPVETRRLRELREKEVAALPIYTGRIDPRFLLIGVSTGGPKALADLLPRLPRDLGLPILIVQHMPAGFTTALAKSLHEKCAFPVREAVDGEAALPNCAYIAPGGRHLKLVSGPARKPLLVVSDEPPENSCRPAVDTLFRSASLSFPAQSIAVILTGMGNDGTLGMRLLKRSGALTIAQDEATSTVFGMPREAINSGVVDQILPLDQIAEAITKLARRPNG